MAGAAGGGAGRRRPAGGACAALCAGRAAPGLLPGAPPPPTGLQVSGAPPTSPAPPRPRGWPGDTGRAALSGPGPAGGLAGRGGVSGGEGAGGVSSPEGVARRPRSVGSRGPCWRARGCSGRGRGCGDRPSSRGTALFPPASPSAVGSGDPPPGDHRARGAGTEASVLGAGSSSTMSIPPAALPRRLPFLSAGLSFPRQRCGGLVVPRGAASGCGKEAGSCLPKPSPGWQGQSVTRGLEGRAPGRASHQQARGRELLPGLLPRCCHVLSGTVPVPGCSNSHP